MEDSHKLAEKGECPATFDGLFRGAFDADLDLVIKARRGEGSREVDKDGARILAQVIDAMLHHQVQLPGNSQEVKTKLQKLLWDMSAQRERVEDYPLPNAFVDEFASLRPPIVRDSVRSILDLRRDAVRSRRECEMLLEAIRLLIEPVLHKKSSL